MQFKVSRTSTSPETGTAAGQGLKLDGGTGAEFYDIAEV